MKKPILNQATKIRSEHDDDESVRMLIYSHDTFGLGHLQRCLKISKSLLTRFQQLSILIVTGSPLVHRFELPERTDYIKLPAVRKIGTEKYEARSLAISYERIIRLRTSLILNVIQEYQPNIMLVDHSPLGMKGEMLPALEWLRTELRDCINIIGLRDIIDAPEDVISLWQKQGIYDKLANLYDQIIIYGDRRIFDTAQAYQFPRRLVARTTYCNYICETDGNQPTNADAKKLSDHPKTVLVTIGGGDGAGELVIGAYITMLREYTSRIDFDSVVLTGPFLSTQLFRELQKAAENLPVKLQRFVPSTTSLMENSDLVISTAGYNTITQILSYGKRSIVIPRILHRREQLFRSKLLNDLGIVKLIHPDELTTDRLFREISGLLFDSSEPVTRARLNGVVQLDGTTQIGEIFSRVLNALRKGSLKEHV